MSDLVLFVKLNPTGHDLPWPSPTKLRGVDLPEPFRCSGDPLCSSGYRKYVDSLRDSSGRAMPGLLAQLAIDPADVERIAFVGYSAAHGLLDALASHPDDRRRISALLLLNATFAQTGALSTKPGYVAFGRDAALGDSLLLSATAHSGGETFMAGDEAFALVWRDIQSVYGGETHNAAVRSPMPPPARGPFRVGVHAYWYDYAGMLSHGGVGQLALPAMEAYLVPFWSGTLTTERRRRGFGKILTLIGAVLAGAAAGSLVKSRPKNEDEEEQ